MIVPDYWAEAKQKFESENGTRTIRRFGWSNESDEAAQKHAERRVQDAIEQLRLGDSVLIREPKVAYNGADGLPIREEVIERFAQDDDKEVVLTRNSYGAICLNTSNVLFADIDVEEKSGCWLYILSWVVVFAGLFTGALRLQIESPFWIALFASMLLGAIFGSLIHYLYQLLRGPENDIAMKRIDHFAQSHSDWVLRIYETPNGYRVLVTHQLFEPRSEAVQDFFKAIDADPVYVRMCFNQNCFRARITPKPWRIGMGDQLRPRRGVWPVRPDRIDERRDWIQKYDAKRVGYSSCRHIKTLGESSRIQRLKDIEFVLRLHDDWCEVDRAQPIA